MIHALYGILQDKEVGHAYIETHGVEWDVQISSATYASLPAKFEEVKLYTHMYVREDLMELYGFATRAERRMFLELISVSGVGCKQALRMLSGLPLDTLIQALDTGDIKVLSSVKGLGVKTAQKLVLSLRDRLELINPGTQRVITEKKQGVIEILRAPLTALVDMGFDRRKATEILEHLHTETVQTEDAEHAGKLAQAHSPQAYEDWLFAQAIARM